MFGLKFIYASSSLAPLHVLNATNSSGFPGGPVVKNLPASAGDARDVGLISELGRLPGRRK